MNYTTLLTDAQKEAFRKGGAYYKSPYMKHGWIE